MSSTYEKELEDLMIGVEAATSRILLSEDRTSKHPPYTWKDEPTEQHLLKSARHILTHLNIKAGGQKPDGENHLDNAITRLAMALFQNETKQ